MRYIAVVTCLLVLGAGCISLDPPIDPTRYFMMNGPEEASEEGGHAVEVKSVELEPYLASPRMVVRLSDNEVRFSDINRWAEPLGDNIRSVLEGYLSVSPIGTISNREASETRLSVRLSVHRFEGLLPDRAVFDVTWSVEDTSGETLVKRHSVHVVSGWGGTDYQQLAGLLDSTVGLLAGEIAASL